MSGKTVNNELGALEEKSRFREFVGPRKLKAKQYTFSNLINDVLYTWFQIKIWGYSHRKLGKLSSLEEATHLSI